MHRRILRRFFIVLAATVGAIVVAIAFRPKPTEVESARVARGPLQVTIDEDGETRAHDRFTLAAPIAGRLSRIRFHEGDEVGSDTVLATISPLPLDARELGEIRARIDATEARRREADEELARSESELAQAIRDFDRTRLLARDHIVSDQQLEQAESRRTAAAKDVEAARFRVQSAAADVEREKAGLISLQAQEHNTSRLVSVRAPARCRILRILEKSERVISFGTPIVILSDPHKIEVVVDVLSTDAVKIKPGAPVIIEDWGGPRPLCARVRVVEPYGFTKISALGIEEQRVNVIADFVDSPDGLGDGYRVEARIVVWENSTVLKVPASALFRVGQRWTVFTIEKGRARMTAVGIGHRNSLEAEIEQGLKEGTQVILHPGNELKDDARVAIRGPQ
jgi:HlyD family secretion protein